MGKWLISQALGPMRVKPIRSWSVAGGRAVSRFEDLLRLVKLIEDLKAGTVKEIRPDV